MNNDLTGRRFGRLYVISREGTQNRNSTWLCQCDCGKVVIVSAPNLKSGSTASCGCLKSEMVTAKNTKHLGSGSKLYWVWDAMKRRCTDPQNKDFPNYGGRGITVCQEWLSDFGAFRLWAEASGYAEGLTIDRIDNGKGYSPDNCQWASRTVQNRNRRPSSEWKRKVTQV